MKLTAIAIAVAFAGATAANAQTDPNAPAVPPGDGISQLGNDPEGQPYTPPGFNVGLSVYPAAAVAQGGQPGRDSYPACSDQVKDRCVQTYTRWTD